MFEIWSRYVELQRMRSCNRTYVILGVWTQALEDVCIVNGWQL